MRCRGGVGSRWTLLSWAGVRRQDSGSGSRCSVGGDHVRRTGPRSGRRSAWRPCSGRPWRRRRTSRGSPSTAARTVSSTGPRKRAVQRRALRRQVADRDRVGAERVEQAGHLDREPVGQVGDQAVGWRRWPEMVRGVPVTSCGSPAARTRWPPRRARAYRPAASCRGSRLDLGEVVGADRDVVADGDPQPLDLARRRAGTTARTRWSARWSRSGSSRAGGTCRRAPAGAARGSAAIRSSSSG